MTKILPGWRKVSTGTAIVIVICIAANVANPGAIPTQLTLFLVGVFIAVRVGIAILDPRTSATILSAADEKAFGRRQLRAGFVISSALLSSLLFEAVRESLAVWLLAPVISLPFVLLAYMRSD